MESPKRCVVGPMVAPQRGQVGASLVIVLLLASAVVSWSVAAMTRGDDSPPGAPAPAAAVTGDKLESHDPANAGPFDGPKHKTYDAALEGAPSSTEHKVRLEVIEDTFEVADGMFMNLWSFEGTVPGPVIRVTQGDTIHFTLVNKGSTAHSMDFHASEVAPNRAYVDVAPGKSFEFDWEASHPGVFMYHCGTPPVLHHVGNGMYGMVIVEPTNQTLAPAREYALIQSELYFGGQGEVGDVTKMEAKAPDWVVFNGYANQYIDDPLIADPGELVRLYLLNAGPSEWSAFHVIGTVFDRTWQEGVAGGPAQTISIAPSQGAIVEFTMDADGMYPFITHALGDASKGAVGTFKVGHGGPASGSGH
jgi:nitrite reductase (NO-forming)